MSDPQLTSRIYQDAQVFLTKIYQPDKANKIPHLMPFLEQLVHEKKISKELLMIIQTNTKKIIEKVAYYCQEILSIPDYEHLAYCIDFLATLKENDTWWEQKIPAAKLKNFEQFLREDEGLKGKINTKAILTSWNITSRSDKFRAFNIKVRLYTLTFNRIGPIVFKNIDLDKALRDWDLVKENSFFDLVKVYLRVILQ